MIPNPARNRRRRGLLFSGLAVAALAALALPGPHGLVSVIVKATRVRRMRAELPRLEARIDTLERTCRYLADPAYASQVAARRFASLRADSSATSRPAVPAP
jgi:hypothetical protein